MHPLRQHIQKTVLLTDDEFEKIISKFKVKKIKKYQFVLQEGNICTFDTFVMDGALRQYYVDDEGKEHVIQFAFKDWWVGDWFSLFNRMPTNYNIDALEYSEILQIEESTLDNLFTEVPKLERYFRIMFQTAFAAQQHRISSLQRPADERYRNFYTLYGHFEQKVSQTQIASYLGITRESLSRLKNQTVKKK